MRILRTARALLAAMMLGLANVLHEGGKRWSIERGYWHGVPQDARFDVTNESRMVLIDKSRDFEANDDIYNRILDLIEKYCTPISCIPASSSETWNKNFRRWWLTNIEPELKQTTVARRWAADGGVLILKSFRRVERPAPGEPSLIPCPQLIESHRIGTPPDKYLQEGVTIFDGIEVWPKYDELGQLNPNYGRVRAFHIRETGSTPSIGGMVLPGFAGGDGTWRRIEAADAVYVTDPDRIGQYHGLPICSPVIENMIKRRELMAMEHAAAKEEASVTWALETPSGEIPAALLSNASREKWQQTTQTAGGKSTTEDRTKTLNSITGAARKIALKLGEKLHRMTGERPSIASQNYWDQLAKGECAGIGVTYLLVFPFSVQGTVTRADLDVTNTFFRAKSAMLALHFLDLYLWCAKWAKSNVRELVDAPGDWNLVTTRAPRSVNVDVGRNSAAMINEVNAGLRTFESWYAEFGQDWREQLEQRAREEAFINKVCADYKISPDRLREIVQPAPEPAANPNRPRRQALPEPAEA